METATRLLRLLALLHARPSWTAPELADRLGVTTDPDHLLTLAQACRRRERLRLMYCDREGTRSLRHLEPLRLVHAHWRWYLVAFDLDRDAWRTFRVDRATAPMATGVRSLDRDDPDSVELVRAAVTVAPYEIQATVRMHLPLAEAQQTWAPRYGVLEADGDTTLLRTGASDADWLARYLAGLPCRVEIVEPVAVRDAFRRHLDRLVGADGAVPA